MRYIIDADARQAYHLEKVITASKTVLDSQKDNLIDADAVQTAARGAELRRMQSSARHQAPIIEA